MGSLNEFRLALLADRVASRFAMEHPSEQALKTYLQGHPGADRSNHTVAPKSSTKKQDSGAADSEAIKSKKRSAETDKHLDTMQGLQKKVDKGDSGSRKKFQKAYDQILEGGASAAKAAEKLVAKYKSVADSLEGDAKDQMSASISNLKGELADWGHQESKHKEHSSTAYVPSHTLMQQADKTNAAAQTLEKAIRQVSKSLKGDYQMEK